MKLHLLILIIIMLTCKNNSIIAQRCDSYVPSINKAIENEQFEVAIKLCKNYIDSLNCIDYNYPLAFAYIQLKEYDKAIKACNEYIALTQNIPDDAYKYRGIAYFGQEKYNEALADFRKSENFDKEFDAEIFFYKLKCYLYTTKFNELIELSTSVLKSNFQNSLLNNNSQLEEAKMLLFYYRGQAYFGLENYQMTLEDINKSISIDKKKVIADNYRLRAYCKEVFEDLKGALADYKIFKELSGPRADCYLGQLYQEMGDHIVAIEHLNSCLTEYPDYLYGFQSRAEAFNDMGDFVSAENDASNFINLCLKQSDISGLENGYNLRCFIRGLAGNYKKALEDYPAALKIDSTNSATYNFYAFALANLDSLEKASYYVQKSIALDSTYGKAYFTRSLIFVKQNKYEKALKDIDKAIPLLKKEQSYYYNMVLEERKRLKKIR